MLSTVTADYNLENSRKCILKFLEDFSHGLLFDSNSSSAGPIPVTGIKYDFLAASGIADEFIGDANSLDGLQEFLDVHRSNANWVFGYISYDVKNGIENLHSGNRDHLNFPEIHFFVPQHVLLSQNGKVQVFSKSDDPEKLKSAVFQNTQKLTSNEFSELQFSHVVNRESYLKNVDVILSHIQRGDIYEMNYCHQFVGTGRNFKPANAFIRLMEISPNPFSAFLKLNKRYLMCASPERFISKSENTIISQPIKGTSARGTDSHSDEVMKHQLHFNSKERSENVMIVDLVRNDFSKIACRGSVKVDELFGVYTFKRSHQMISTIRCELKPHTNFNTIIKSVFPMGSMTGAPKISAMKIIEQVEDFIRGLFSGTVGYIDPSGNFDFNVVIRSILYNEQNQYISIQAGSAITIDCDAEKEYEECLLKAKAMLEALG